MHQQTLVRIYRSRDTIPGLALGAVWFAGLSLGMIAASFYGDPLAEFCLIASASDTNLIHLIGTGLLPLLLSACAVSLFPSGCVYGICLGRGFCLGLLLEAVGRCFGSGAPLVGGLLLFSTLCSSPVLLWYCWRRLRGMHEEFWKDTFGCLAICAGISTADHLWIAPFLAYVIDL